MNDWLMDGQTDGLMDRGMDRDKLTDGHKRRKEEIFFQLSYSSSVKDAGKFIGKAFAS